MIGEEPPKTSDPELAAKRAIDEAVATLRSLAEGPQARATPRPAGDTGVQAAPRDNRPPEAPLIPTVPLAPRLREGFHRLGVVLALACAAIAGAVLLATSDLSGGQPDIRRAFPLLLAALAAYPLCQSAAWVVLGFIGEPQSNNRAEVTAARGAAQVRDPRGIGGWLWLPIIAILVTLVWTGKAAFESAQYLAPSLAHSAPLGAYMTSAVVVNLALLLGWAYELYLIAKRRRLARRLYVALSLASLASFVVFSLASVAYFGLRPDQLLTGAVEELVHAVWIPYMLRSRRVRSTLVN